MNKKETYCLKEVTARVEVERKLVKSVPLWLIIEREMFKELKPLENGDGDVIYTIENKEVVKIVSDFSKPDDWLIRIERSQVKTDHYNKNQVGFSDQIIRRKETLERNLGHEIMRQNWNGADGETGKNGAILKSTISVPDGEPVDKEDFSSFEEVSALPEYHSADDISVGGGDNVQGFLLGGAASRPSMDKKSESSGNPAGEEASSSSSLEASGMPSSNSSRSNSSSYEGSGCTKTKVDASQETSSSEQRYGPTPAASEASSKLVEENIYEEIKGDEEKDLNSQKSQSLNGGVDEDMKSQKNQDLKRQVVSEEFAERLNLKPVEQSDTSIIPVEAQRGIIPTDAQNSLMEPRTILTVDEPAIGGGRIREVFHMDFSHLVVEREIPKK